MRDSVSPPEFLIDRSLGRHVLARSLADVGFQVHTLADVYGDREESVADVEWLERAGREGWVVLTKDARIRYRSTELAAIRSSGAKVFVVSAKKLTGPQIADQVLANLNRIVQAARKKGPFIYAVYEKRIALMWSKDSM